MLPDSKVTNLVSSNQEGSPSVDKNTRVLLLSCVWKCVLVWKFLGSVGVIFYNRRVLSEDHKNYFKDCCP